MARQVLLFLLVAFLNVSLILCREDYQHHISDSFSHHHRRSTPEDSVVSTKDPLSVTEGEGKPLGEIQHGFRIHPISHSMPDDNTTTIILINVSILVAFFLILLCIGLTFFFAKKICQKRRQGLIMYRPLVNSSEMRQQQETAVKTETQQPTHNVEGTGSQNIYPQHIPQPSHNIYGIELQNASSTQPTQ